MKIKSAAFQFVAAMVAAVAVASCAVGVNEDMADVGMMVDRRMVDETTGAPIAGAWISMRWYSYSSTIGGQNHSCRHASSVQTDSDGRYRVPTWHGSLPRLTRSYKPGYVPGRLLPKIPADEMKAIAQTDQERRQELYSMLGATECGDEIDEGAKGLFDALAAEASLRWGAGSKIAQPFIDTAGIRRMGLEAYRRSQRSASERSGK